MVAWTAEGSCGGVGAGGVRLLDCARAGADPHLATCGAEPQRTPFVAAGFGGQVIEVVPDLDMIVVAATTIPENPTMDAEPLLMLVDEVIAPAVVP